MARKEFLSAQDRTRFDYPPELSAELRNSLMQMPQWASEYVHHLQTPTNKVGFILQLGYFRIVSRFFVASRYPLPDIEYVARRIYMDPNGVDMSVYLGTTYHRHQTDILAKLGYQAFDTPATTLVLQEAKRLAGLQTQPTLILEALVGFLDDHRIQIPTYATLRSLLNQALRTYEAQLETILTSHLTTQDKELLDSLLKQHISYQEDERRHLKIKRYELTFFKRISQSMQPSVIKGRVENFERLKSMYQQLFPVIERLGLSQNVIRFYAEYVIDNQVFQVADRTTLRYLLLIAFIIHQYYQLGDALIQTLNEAVSSALGECEDQIKDNLYANRLSTARLVNTVTARSRSHIEILQEVDRIIHHPDLESDQKVTLIEELLQQKRLTSTVLTFDEQRLTDLKLINTRINDREDFYETLEKESIKLQARVSAIVKALVPDQATSQKDILAAFLYFQQKEGIIAQGVTVPLGFLSLEERQKVFTLEGKLRVSLYKVFLFREIRNHLRAGSLNIHSCYEYRSLEEYLISRLQWLKEKDKLLQKACLTQHLRVGPTLLTLNEELNRRFKVVNTHIEAGQNAQVYFDKAGNWHLHRYRAEEQPEVELENLYPQHRAVSLLEVLTTVDSLTGFTNAFEHKGLDYRPSRPADKFFYATIIGLGCNIGIRKMSFISRGVSTNGLETTAMHYFSPDMTLKANDLILAFSNRLPLTAQFQGHPGYIHTASDGQKYDVSVASLRSAWSFKYFGHGKGVTVYSHLDEAGQLIYSTVFSADHREALYVLNGLMHNGIINPDAHSTDTHGFSEAVFAITALLGIAFRPRLAKVHEQQLFSIDSVATYREQGYRIKPDSRINYELIIEQWDEILRMVTTIKLGYAQASTLFKRLNSYSRQHPLYKALKELGRLFKTNFILQYIDEPLIRQSIERVLSKMENGNKFSKAITHGNNQQLIGATYREQLTAEGCKRVIANAINCYNLLYLSDLYQQCPGIAQKEALLKDILKTSTHSWGHINMVGEYNFVEQDNYQKFDVPTILKLFDAA